MTCSKKKTVGLLTIHGIHNFGSVLQTLATIRLTEKLGFSCRLINYQFPARYHKMYAANGENVPAWKQWIKKTAACLNLFDIISWGRLILRGEYRSYSASQKKYDLFLQDLPSTERCTKRTVACMDSRFDVFLVGSDQTWNPRYLYRDYTFLLDFVSEGKKKLSYASSFGAKKMMPEFKDDYAFFLKRFDHLSVREQSGIPLIKELTGKDAVHCVDPTLTMTAEDWRKEADYRSCPQKPYLLCYVLDYVFDPYPYILDLISFVAEELGLEVYFLTNRRNKLVEKFGFVCHYDQGPREFLGLYDKASFVISTSFHGTAFSVIFHKSFIAVTNPNDSADDRVMDLLDSLHLNAAGIKASADIPLKKINLHTDYSNTDPILKDIRDRSEAYLRKALEEEEQHEEFKSVV